ncbi:hypothetical protein JTB14_026079 [Gonioctena quinquepunctata]|nr:hypothetical protein JTB14_026079 [Gonioctena quinquepunctata]
MIENEDITELQDDRFNERAVDDEEWRSAIDEEISAHDKHSTWEPAYLPSEKQAIDIRWIFTIKQGHQKKPKAFRSNCPMMSTRQ